MEIKCSHKDTQHIDHPDDVYDIMQRILLRENKIDREKEHFWVIGMNADGYILYIELVNPGSIDMATVEPMKVFRVAVMKNAARIIVVHNHPSGNLMPSEEDRDTTDRLIQAGRILGVEMADHLIINPKSYLSFDAMGWIAELSRSLKYVPPYQVIDRVREEEKEIAKNAAQAEQRQIEKSLVSTIAFLRETQMTVEEIARVLGITPQEVGQKIKKR